MSPQNSETARHSLLAAGVITLITVVFTTMYRLTPVCLDDLGFLEYYRQCSGDGTFTLQGLIELIKTVRFEENGRPGNVICPLWIIYLPSWLGHILLGLMTTGVIWGAAAIASGRRPDAKALIAIWLLCTFLLPWRARLFVTDYALNYIPATLLLLLFVWLFLKPAHTKPGIAAATLLLAAGIATGIQHEGLVTVTTAAIGLYTIGRRFRLHSRQWILLAGFACGAALLLSSPGIWIKLDASPPQGFELKRIVLGTPAFVAFMILFVTATAIPRWRRHCLQLLRQPVFQLSLAMIISGIIINLRIGFFNPRTTWFAQVFAIIACCMMLRSAVSSRIFTGLAAIVLLTFWGVVIKWQSYFHTAYSDIERQLETSATGTTYYDLDTRCPRYTLQIPLFSVWSEPTQLVAANMLYSPRVVATVPEALRNFRADSTTVIPGSAGAVAFNGIPLLADRPLHRIDGHGIQQPATVESTRLDLYTASGQVWRNEPVNMIRFIAAPSDTMLLISPAHWRVKGPFIRIDNPQYE